MVCEYWSFVQRPNREIIQRLENLDLHTDTIQFGQDIYSNRFTDPSSIARIICEMRRKFGPYRAFTVHTQQHVHLAPAAPEFTDTTIAYCDSAVQFLYNHPDFQSLDRHVINWSPAQLGMDLSEANDDNAYISDGSILHQTLTAYVHNEPGKKITMTFRKETMSSAVYLEFQPGTDQLRHWSIFVAPGSRVLSAPFSEVLPLTTGKKITAYATLVGNDEAIALDEGLNEGFRTFLQEEYVQECGVPHGIQLVQESLAATLHANPHYYRHVLPAIAWMKKHGMKNALELYMDTPQKFKHALYTKSTPSPVQTAGKLYKPILA